VYHIDYTTDCKIRMNLYKKQKEFFLHCSMVFQSKAVVVLAFTP